MPPRFQGSGTGSCGRVAGSRCRDPAPSEPDVQDFPASGSSKPRGLRRSAGLCGLFATATAESFFASLQTELLDRQIWRTRQQLGNAIFDYLEAWYNPRRRHSSLGAGPRSPHDADNSCADLPNVELLLAEAGPRPGGRCFGRDGTVVAFTHRQALG